MKKQNKKLNKNRNKNIHKNQINRTQQIIFHYWTKNKNKI
jgi:hypothetical protein